MPNRTDSTINLAKAERNRKIYGYAISHPELTLRDLAAMFGLSFQRIHQVIKREEHNGKTKQAVDI